MPKFDAGYHVTVDMLARALRDSAPPARVAGDAKVVLDGAATLANAEPGDLAFLANSRYRSQLAGTRAGCVVAAEGDIPQPIPGQRVFIVTDRPYLYFARALQWIDSQSRLRAGPRGIDPSASIDATASIGAGTSVSARAVIGPGAVIGANARIGAGAVLGERCSVGDGTEIHPNVTIYRGVRIGRRCIVHGGAVIGADGFGFAPDAGTWAKIPQLGSVSIGDDVEIGANTTIDRGALDDTVIEDGVKLDNQIQIGHNVRVGAHTAMAGCVGIAGSASIGSRCTLGGGAIVLGHLTLADDVHISAASVVMKSITVAGNYSGVFPIDTNANWERNAAALRQLAELRRRLRGMEGKS